MFSSSKKPFIARTLFLLPLLFFSMAPLAKSHVEVSLSQIGLAEGNLIRATSSGDPDVYIVNEWGYKRLILSPLIYSFYGHLKPERVKAVESYVIDALPSSALFRNCEASDPRVYALEIISDDLASLHWVNISGNDVVEDDHDFFKKVFCINKREFGSFSRSTAYTALSQIPVYKRQGLPTPPINETNMPLTLPDGFRIGVFTSSSIGPLRFMAFSPDGILFVSMPSSAGLYSSARTDDGKIFALPDRDGNGKTDEVITVLSGLHIPHGVAFYNNYLYVAEEDKISRYPYLGGGNVGTRNTIVSDLPAGGDGHVSRTIGFGSNGKMYVSIGSLCNGCEETDSKRATILEYNPDGSGERVFARGLRNAVGFVFHPETGEIWATENGRDWLGDDLPPDEINVVRDGKHYGWPYCYGENRIDPQFSGSTFCATAQGSTYDIQAHSAALGLSFISGSQFPESWHGDILVAYHGSWNRSEPVGYSVSRLDVEDNAIVGEHDFVTGWLKSDGTKIGRPVDVIFGPDGALYISDDKANVIYRVTKI